MFLIGLKYCLEDEEFRNLNELIWVNFAKDMKEIGKTKKKGNEKELENEKGRRGAI
jgi:hypothetical protein